MIDVQPIGSLLDPPDDLVAVDVDCVWVDCAISTNGRAHAAALAFTIHDLERREAAAACGTISTGGYALTGMAQVLAELPAEVSREN